MPEQIRLVVALAPRLQPGDDLAQLAVQRCLGEPSRVDMRTQAAELPRLALLPIVDDDLGPAHATLPVFGGDDSLAELAGEAGGERIAALRSAGMHADFLEIEQPIEQPHVPVRGPARADM